MDELQTRGERLLSALPAGIDGVLVASEANRFYFCGVRATDGLLLLTPNRSILLADSRYIEMARKTVTGAEAVLTTASRTQLAELCAERGVKTLAVEAARMTLAEYARLRERLPGVTLVDTGEADAAIAALRRRKDAVELAAIRSAQAITDAAFTEICDFIRPGVTERQVAARLEYIMKQSGADGLAFETIAVSGANSSLPHGVPGDKPLAAGDFLTLDFGAVKNGYCSDMTRTVAVESATDEMRAVYATVLEAQLAGLAAVEAEKPCADIDFAARSIIEGRYPGCFGHGLGHSVGIEIHEEPRFSPLSRQTCAAGDVMTVEPGVYLEGRFGCRIEDMVAVGETGAENLTASPKSLLVL